MKPVMSWVFILQRVPEKSLKRKILSWEETPECRTTPLPDSRQNGCLQLQKESTNTLSLHKPQTGRHVGYLFSKIWMLFLSNSYFSGLAGPNMPAFSYNPKKNVPNPAVRENYLNSFLYADFFASRGGSKKLQRTKCLRHFNSPAPQYWGVRFFFPFISSIRFIWISFKKSLQTITKKWFISSIHVLP